MTKLSDTQAIILSTAAQRSDGSILPLPGSLRGGAATKVVAALLARGLIREHVVDSPRKADPSLNTVWRNLEDGRAVLLFITAAGAGAIGIELDAGQPMSTGEAPVEPAPSTRRGRKTAAPTAPDAPRKTRDGTKQAQLIAMLRRKQGATIAQIVEATGWQPHTARGALAGAIKKKLGLSVVSEKVGGGERIYRIA